MKPLSILFALTFFVCFKVFSQDTSYYKVSETWDSYEESDNHSIVYEKMHVYITYETVYIRDSDPNASRTIPIRSYWAHGFILTNTGVHISDSGRYSVINYMVSSNDSIVVCVFGVDSMQGIANLDKICFWGISRSDLVSINEIDSYQKLTVFPNPVSDRISIEGIEGEYSYRIYDLNGSFISEGNKNNSSIYVGYLSTGNYILHIKSGNSNYSTRLIKL